MIVFYEAMWKAYPCRRRGSQELSIDRFGVGHIGSVGKVGETVSTDDAINLSLSFFLDNRIDGHVIEEAAGRRDCL